MNTQSYRSLSSELAHRVEAFEVALRADPEADIGPHLPEPDHPLYLPLLGELIRIDLERSWGRGRGRRLAEYAARFPVLLEQPVLLGAVAFEEYRQRIWAGQPARAAEYREAYGLDTADWPELSLGPRPPETDPARTPVPTGLAGLARPEEWRTGRMSIRPIANAPESGDCLLSGWQEAAEALPAPGATFLGFRLVEELGRGAFGRVYLARQGDLAGRPVALKVACDIGDESQTLAQLQHTNIVPIYSFHRTGPFQAVCMPYFGRTTLAHVVRHISGRPTLPSSGRELRSTLEVAKDATAGGAGLPPAPTPAHLPSLPLPVAVVAQGEGLDGWSRLEKLSYIEAVLTLGGQLADGLGHAHRRGILHRDLKPANVLLTDDGRPMLLDFNLAEDLKRRDAAERASVGGTLPYMSPEHIECYRTGTGRLDARCDLFGLGVILFELLAGRHPYTVHKRATAEVVAAMVDERRRTPPSLRQFNAAVPPAVEAIVRKCLEPDPAARYQSAEELREDIDLHLSHRPLRHARNPSTRELARKWLRRHPRLTSSGTVAALAAVLLVAVVAGAVYSRERTRGLEARGRFAEHQAAFRDAQVFLDDRNRSWPRLGEAVGKLRGVLARYDVPDDPAAGDGWLQSASLRYLPEPERTRVREDVGETFYLMAQVASLRALGGDAGERAEQARRAVRWNELAARYGEARLPRAVREQRAVLAELQGEPGEADRLRQEAGGVPLVSARDCFLVGTQLARQNRHRDALEHLDRATRLDPENFSAWFVRGSSHQALEQYEFAAMCYSACVSLRPDSAPAWTNRGLAFAGLRFRPHAIKDYDRALELEPKLVEALMYRAQARREEGDLAGAEDDYSRALDSGRAPARVYFLRATVRQLRGNKDGASADREAGFGVKPTDELSWIAWAENTMKDDPAAALAHVEEALKLNPMSMPGHQLKAHLLAERLNRPEDSLAVLNRAVELHPDSARLVAGRGVVLARAGKREEALRDAKTALRIDARPPNLYQVGCIYALSAKTHPEDRREALRLLWQSLRTGWGLDLVRTDRDLKDLRDDPEFKDILRDASALRRPQPLSGGSKK